MLLVAGVLVAVALAFAGVYLVPYAAHRRWISQPTRPARGWIWEQSWQRQVLLGLAVVAAVGGGIALAAMVPPGSRHEPLVRLVLLLCLAGLALVAKGRNRRDGVKTNAPFMHHGPPGWTWDPDRGTWRPP